MKKKNTEPLYEYSDTSFSPTGTDGENNDGGAMPEPLNVSPLFGTSDRSTAKPDEAQVPPPTFKTFEFFKKAQYKKKLIAKILTEYKKPLEGHIPSEQDCTTYEKQLKVLKLKQLLYISSIVEYPLKLDAIDRLKSIDKKKHAVVTIFNDNKTTDTGVCHINTRTFSRNKMRYIVMSERGFYDPEFKMVHFYYYSNNPWPIIFSKNKLPVGESDGLLLDDTIEMSVVEALANINMSSLVKLILILVIFDLVIDAIIAFVSVKGAGII